MMHRGTLLILAAVATLLGDAAAADLKIVQKNRAFSARQLTIKAGDQVTFVNDDTVNHNVYSETKGFEFDVPVMKLAVQVTP